ncbi:hypothetical protein ACJBCE_11810 [Streptomyces sp. NBUL23]
MTTTTDSDRQRPTTSDSAEIGDSDHIITTAITTTQRMRQR